MLFSLKNGLIVWIIKIKLSDMKHFLTNGVHNVNCVFTRRKVLIQAFLFAFTASGQAYNDTASQLYEKGWHYRFALQFDSAIYYLSQAEEAINRRTEPLVRARIYSGIGDILHLNRNYTQSNAYFEKSIKYYREANYPKMVAYNLNRMGGNLYYETKDLPAALRYIREAQAVAPDDTILGITLQQIGFLYYCEGVQDSARLYLYQSLAYPFYRDEQSFRLLTLANSYFSTNQLDSAKHYSLEALKYPMGNYQKKECYRQLYEIAELQNDADALACYGALSLQQQRKTNRMESKLSQELQDIHQTQVDKLDVRHKKDAIWLLVACGAVVVLAGGVWLLVRFVRYYKRWQATARVRHKNLHVRNERLAKENGKLATRNRKLASENENLAARNKHLREALERERQQRESYAQLKQSLLCAYKTERNRVLESRLQHLKEQLDAACAPAEQCPLLSQEYKKAIAKGYRQVLHWDAPEACLTLFNEQFDHFADRAEQWCANRRSQKRSTARLCCLLLVDTMKTHVEILMDYKEGTYERTLDRLQRNTCTATEQDFRLELYKVAFLKAEN